MGSLQNSPREAPEELLPLVPLVARTVAMCDPEGDLRELASEMGIMMEAERAARGEEAWKRCGGAALSSVWKREKKSVLAEVKGVDGEDWSAERRTAWLSICLARCAALA